MDIKEIIKTYGRCDYYDTKTGEIYLLSKMVYDKINDRTCIPVFKDGSVANMLIMEGDLYEIMA